MVVTSRVAGYSHTQYAPLHLLLYACALGSFGVGLSNGGVPGIYIAGGVGLVIALITPAFHHLTVEDQGKVK